MNSRPHVSPTSTDDALPFLQAHFTKANSDFFLEVINSSSRTNQNAELWFREIDAALFEDDGVVTLWVQEHLAETIRMLTEGEVAGIVAAQILIEEAAAPQLTKQVQAFIEQRKAESTLHGISKQE